VVLLPHQEQEGADIIASRIREHLLATPLKIEDKTIPVVISYGVISTDQMERVDSKSILKRADERLYEMKKLKPSNKPMLDTSTAKA